MADPRTLPEYIADLDALTGLCRALRVLPLAEMAEKNEQMQALGPIVAPTEFARASINLRHQRDLIDAARALQEVVERIAGDQEG